MKVIPTRMTVAEYCDSLTRQTLIVNPTYQRQPGVWPPAAQSFFVESILRGFPIPKISLFAKTDRLTRQTIREIVDGQQRTLAIKKFYDGKLKLSKNLELADAAGRTYDQLGSALQDCFLSYSLDIDEYVATNPDEIREVFRRINSYVVALNAEEQRHATWQGDFKWYVYHLSRDLDDKLLRVNVFTERQLVRMQDMKVFAEITHGLIHGIKTTTKRSLDSLYKDYNSTFDSSDQYTDWIREACNRIFTMPKIWGTALVRPYSFYSFVLAAIHAVHNVASLRTLLGAGGFNIAANNDIENRLLDLLNSVEDKDDTGVYGEFVKATMSKTNAQAHRIARTKIFLDALRSDGGRTFGTQSRE